MTRNSLQRTLRRVYWVVGTVLVFCFVAKIADHIPGLAGTGVEKILKDIYELLRDMSLLIATGGVAYITNAFQRRSSFIDALRQEWREIVQTKSALFAYTQIEHPTADDYIVTFCKLSETIDNMRTVYRNVGETSELIGLYPYAPLHDMRRVLQTLDPRKVQELSADDRRLARNAMLQSFYALRESFLEELDLEEPKTSLLPYAGKRLKRSGAHQTAVAEQMAQGERLSARSTDSPEIDELHKILYEAEHATEKPWRPNGKRAVGASIEGTGARPSEAIRAATPEPLT